MKWLLWLKRLIIFTILTVVTQIGGLVYIANSILIHKLNHKISTYKRATKYLSFFVIYFFSTFILVPIIAKSFNRIQLPITEKNNIKPINKLTCLLNRNYVSVEMYDVLLAVAEKVNQKNKGTTLGYLDANFPFINGFPLLPHLSHNDGNKLDIAFCYKDSTTNKGVNSSPSFLGYGICEEPKDQEENIGEICANKGAWQYNLLKNITPHINNTYLFDEEKTKFVIETFCNQEKVNKIFIEPHLKKRLGITNDKVRFQGCHSVRHDDHIHIQIK